MVHREPERAALSTRNAMKYRLILCSFLSSCLFLTILSSNIIRDHTIDDLGETLSNLYSFFFSPLDCYSISFTFSNDGGQFGTLRVTWFEPCQKLWHRNRAERKFGWRQTGNRRDPHRITVRKRMPVKLPLFRIPWLHRCACAVSLLLPPWHRVNLVIPTTAASRLCAPSSPCYKYTTGVQHSIRNGSVLISG